MRIPMEQGNSCDSEKLPLLRGQDHKITEGIQDLQAKSD